MNMYRHSPSRNQRSKGFKLKHVLQICVLVAVCLWLIYQVKHSHDKRKHFDENIAKDSLNMERSNVIVKFGRKDLISEEKGAKKDIESHDGEAEEDDNEEGNIEQDKRKNENKVEAKHEEETEEEDKQEDESEENDTHEEETVKEDEHEEEAGEEDKHEEEAGEEDKHEEETEEENIQAEEKDDEGRGDGDDEVNEHEQEKADSDVDGEQEFIHDEKEKEEDPIEKVTEEKNDDEDQDTRRKNDPSIEDHVHDEGSKNTREAREEQYKGDDASSAVTHDAQSTSTENDNGSTLNQLNILEHEANSTVDGQNTTVVNLNKVEIAGNGTSGSDEEKNPAVVESISHINSSLASVTGFKSNDQQGSINITDNNGSSVNNETGIIISDPSLVHNATEGNRTATDGSNNQTIILNQATNSTETLHDTELNSNSSNSNATKTVEGNSEESTDSSTKPEFDNTKNVEESNVSAEGKDGSDSSVLEETTNEVENENQGNNKGTDEVQYDSIDTSDPSLEDKENHIDLDTLPEIRTEGSNSEEIAED